MRTLIEKHKTLWKSKRFASGMVSGFLMLAISLSVNYIASVYAVYKASMPVTDIILDNLPVIRVDFIIIEGAALLILFVTLIALRDPQKTPFILKSVALFIIIRSIFITLTHLGPAAPQALPDPSQLLRGIGIGDPADFFFSGHTGLPFLMALIFWENKKLRTIFFAWSLVFASSVLLGHLHYSIDVFAAFFITYSIYEIAKKYFHGDYLLFHHGLDDPHTNIQHRPEHIS